MKVAVAHRDRLVREAVRRTLARSRFELVAQAGDLDALERERRDHAPRLVLVELDLLGPGAARLSPLLQDGVVVVVLASTADRGAYEAMGRGALALVEPPRLGDDGSLVGGDRVLARLERLARLIDDAPDEAPTAPLTRKGQVPILALGASTGGPLALARILSELPQDFEASVLVVQHIEGEFSSGLAEWLGTQCKLPVALAAPGRKPEAGHVHVAGPDAHLVVMPSLQLAQQPPQPGELHVPSIDVLLFSLARHLRPGAAAILTGMGSDGVAGMGELRRRGWLTVAQDEASSVVYGMPRAAVEAGAARQVVPLAEMGSTLVRHFPERGSLMLPTLRVLVIDDQPIVLEAVRYMLIEAGGIEVHLHRDPVTAIETALALRPDVVLLDLNMEPIDGLDILSQMRGEPSLSEIAIVMLSAAEDPTTKVEAFRRGANDYVVKLPSAVELVARVRYHARAFQAAREREAAFQALLESRAVLEERNQLIERQKARLEELNVELTEAALTDALTGLRNRRYFKQALEGAAGDGGASRAAGDATAASAALYLLDLDHFKHVNDRHGHEAGDVVLVEVARRMRGCLRKGDAALRWGGEEFLIVALVDGEEGATNLAARLLDVLGAEPMVLPGGEALTVTCSAGFTPIPCGVPASGVRPSNERLLNIADAALYMSKLDGRNRAIGVFPGADMGVVERMREHSLDVESLRGEEGKGVRLVRVDGPRREER